MRKIEKIKNNNRLMIVQERADGLAAYLVHPRYKLHAVGIIASWGGGWEHVSVSLKTAAQPGRKCAWLRTSSGKRASVSWNSTRRRASM